jgi:hypothetical protein
MPADLRIRPALLAATASLLLSAQGCVDPDGRYDDFIERTASMRGRDAGAERDAGVEADAGDGADARFDFSGTYLVALSTTLAPGEPILFSADVVVSDDLETIDFTFQTLSTDADDAPREPVGDPVTADAVPYQADGSFEVDLGEVTVPGRANPISGSDIVATVVLTATAFPATAELPAFFCGDASGMVTVPLALDLAGSTIGGVEASSFEGVEPLPACP